MRISDWSSDVCSSDLNAEVLPLLERLSAAISEWPEDGAPKDAGEIGTAIDALFVRTEQDETRRMLWVAGSVATALSEGALQPSAGLRQAFASVRSEGHTSELQSLMRISYAVFCLKKKTKQ